MSKKVLMIDLTNIHRDEIDELKLYLERQCWSWEEKLVERKVTTIIEDIKN
jgi:hypothetical protein